MVTAAKDHSSKLRWSLLILCTFAMILSAWLTYQKLTGKIDSLAGCGKGSDCSNILGSRWSVVLGVIPVSLPSFFVYLAIVVSLWKKSTLVKKVQLVVAWILLGAAIWFIGLQFFQFSGFCKYCMITHSIGVLVALGLFWMCGRGHVTECVSTLPVGVTAVAVLALIQIFGPVPDTHRVDSVSGTGSNSGVHAAGSGRLVTFLGGNKAYRLEPLPHLGKADARHVLVKYFDYTCHSCSLVDEYLEATLSQHPDDVVVIVLPTPLNRTCNDHLPASVKDHAKACELARCALAVWLAEPGEFAGYHHWLFQNHTGSINAAKAEAIRRVGQKAFQNALASDWVDQIIRKNAQDYRILIQRTPVMPKLLLGDNRLMQGASSSSASFIRELKKHLPLN